MLKRNRILACLVAVMMLIVMMPTASYAIDPSTLTYPITIKVYTGEDASGNPITKDVTYNSADDAIGQHPYTRSDWGYKTFRKVFIGWSTDPKFAKSSEVSYDDRIYRDVEPISAVISDLETVDENTVLYPVVLQVTELVTLFNNLTVQSGSFSINKYQSDSDIFEQADLIKKSAGKDDATATERKIVSYYDSDLSKYSIRGFAEFYYTEPTVPFLVLENPFGVIKSANGVTDFSGLNPQDYTYEDLHVTLAPDATISKSQKNWEFSSAEFMVAAVLDQDGNELTSTITKPDPDSLISKFSFENPDELNEFTIRTIPRGDNTDWAYGFGTTSQPHNAITNASGADVMAPMTLSTGDWSNISIPKTAAKQAAMDEGGVVNFNSTGSISGLVKSDKSRLTGGAALIAPFLDDEKEIKAVTSNNDATYEFVPAVAKFDKNSVALGDTEEQTIGYSIFAVNQSMNGDDFNTNAAPGPIDAKGDTFAADFVVGQSYDIDGKQCVFKGWNTAADGSGTDVTAATNLSVDMLTKDSEIDLTLFAQWQEPAGQEPPVPFRYRTGVQGSTKWQDWRNPGEESGSVAKSLRMEGLQIELENAPYEGSIRYQAQIEKLGWQDWKINGETAGFNPQRTGGKRLESIKIELTGEMANHYDVWYHMHTQRFAWMGWAKNGEPAGTVGYSFRVEAIEILILPKGSTPSTPTEIETPDANMLSYVRAESYDNKQWQGPKGEGDVSGTRARKKTAMMIGLSQSGIPEEYRGSGSGITYRVYQDGKWSAWKKDDEEVGNRRGGAIQGIQIKLTGEMAKDYDVYYRTEVRTSNNFYWLNWAQNGETAGWKGKNLEQLSISIIKKGDPAPPTADNNHKQRWVLQRYPVANDKTNVGF